MFKLSFNVDHFFIDLISPSVCFLYCSQIDDNDDDAIIRPMSRKKGDVRQL